MVSATALEDLLGVPMEKVHADRLYKGLDWLLPHKAQIEKHLKERLGSLFDLEYDLLLYNVTSTYFEGACAGNGLAKRGYSRDSRPDCLQVCIGLVVTTDGIPLGYEVFAGNRHDSTTVEEIVEAMEKKYGRANRIWVMDRDAARRMRFLRERNGSTLWARQAMSAFGLTRRLRRRMVQVTLQARSAKPRSRAACEV